MIKKELGLKESIVIITSGCIGSAIYSLSGLTMYWAGSAVILSWIIASLIMSLYAFQTVKMAEKTTISGGVYIFPALKFGRFWGFASSWGFIVANIIAISFSAIYVCSYLSVIFKSLSKLNTIFAIISCVIVFLLNTSSYKRSKVFSGILALFLFLSLVVYSACMFSSKNYDISLFSPFFNGAKGNTGFISSIPTAMVAYGSLVSVSFMAGRVKNPKKTLPISLFVSSLVVTLLYVFVILSTLGHISFNDFLNNPLSRFTPLFSAISKNEHLSFLSPLISFSAVAALLTTMLVVEDVTVYQIKALCDDGVLPRSISKLNKHSKPIYIHIIILFLTIALSCIPSVTENLVNLASFTAAISIVVVLFSCANIASYITSFVILLTYIPAIVHGSIYMWIYSFSVYAVGVLIYTFRRAKHSITGRVIQGNKIGRTINFPTANINLDYNRFSKKYKKIKRGVYTAGVLIDGEFYKGIANIGNKPTVESSSSELLEVHILNFDKDIYNKTINVNLYSYIRDIEKFSTLDELKERLKKDKEIAQNMNY